nr:hypothetical protein [Nitrosomonas sp.]
RWLQQLRWNIARDIFIDRWDYLKIGHVFGKKCPLIEEAQWFLSVVPVVTEPPESQNIDMILEHGRTPRHLAYVGILRRNYDIIKDAAVNGDPAAQFWLAVMPGHEEGKLEWLTRSAHNGYSDAFRPLADELKVKNYNRVNTLLRAGVLAGSWLAIAAYARTAEVNEQQGLYLTGQSWMLFQPRVSMPFIRHLSRWFQKPEHERDPTSAFIIGEFFKRLPPEEIHRLSVFAGNKLIYNALEAGYKVYSVMIAASREAVFTWMLISQRLPIVKDIRRLIAKEIWATRDRSDWVI